MIFGLIIGMLKVGVSGKGLVVLDCFFFIGLGVEFVSCVKGLVGCMFFVVFKVRDRDMFWVVN